MTHKYYTIIFLFFLSSASAQSYDFIQYHKNKIYQPSSDLLDPFFEKINHLEHQTTNQKVNIVHIGDSHIQADFFSGRVRHLLQNRFADGGRGFTFPYTAAHTNNPKDYITEYTGRWKGKRSVLEKTFSQWGVSGVNAVTYDENATITIRPSEKSGKPFYIKKIKIFYPVFDPRSFHVQINTNYDNIISKHSDRQGYVEYTFAHPESSVTLQMSKITPHQSQLVMQGISVESQTSGVVYHAIGANGAKVPTFFRCQDFGKHLKALKPDLVIISLGANDAHSYYFQPQTYKNNFKSLVNDIWKAVPQTKIMITTPGDAYRGRRFNHNPSKIRDILYILAQEMNLAVWDFYGIMGGVHSIDRWKKNHLAQKDRLHLTVKGYRLQGNLFYHALSKAYKEYLGQTRHLSLLNHNDSFLGQK